MHLMASHGVGRLWVWLYYMAWASLTSELSQEYQELMRNYVVIEWYEQAKKDNKINSLGPSTSWDDGHAHPPPKRRRLIVSKAPISLA